MKKYKVHFSFTNLLGATQEEVVRIQMLLKGLTTSGAVGTWLASDGNHAVYVGFAGIVADTLLGCLYFELKNNNEKPNTDTTP